MHRDLSSVCLAPDTRKWRHTSPISWAHATEPVLIRQVMKPSTRSTTCPLGHSTDASDLEARTSAVCTTSSVEICNNPVPANFASTSVGGRRATSTSALWVGTVFQGRQDCATLLMRETRWQKRRCHSDTTTLTKTPSALSESDAPHQTGF